VVTGFVGDEVEVVEFVVVCHGVASVWWFGLVLAVLSLIFFIIAVRLRG
jgi:hypothetical protein